MTFGLVRGALTASILMVSASAAFGQQAPNTLTKEEVAGGWKLLFDGKGTTGWRGFKQAKFPEKGWAIEDGCLKSVPEPGASDIITEQQYGDFELELDWKASPKGNSGIIYRIAEKHDATWQTGPEYQILDDLNYGVTLTDMHSSGALYDMWAPAAGKPFKGAGEWNHARILIRDGVVQHWMNGFKVVEARMDDKEWKDRIAKSKFKDYEGFGVQAKGFLGLQNHGDTLWFRNIKVRDLSAALPGEVKLFNGKDLTGWKPVLNDNGKPEDVWSVKDGVLICKGNPVGYIRTEKDYENYVLKLEWRFNPVTKQAGNSGVLLRMVGEDKVWPKSVEAQLESGSAGDFWNIDKFKMKVDMSRTEGRNTKKTHGAERPIGEWNEYEIIVSGGNITLKVNGEILNEATEVEQVPGKICLQSEGAEIHFRNIRLAPLPR